MSSRSPFLRTVVTLLLGTFFLSCSGNVNRGATDVFMVTLVSEHPKGLPVYPSGGGVTNTTSPVISGNGRYVAFTTPDWLIPGADVVDMPQVYVFDSVTRIISLVTWTWDYSSVSLFTQDPRVTSMSSDGRYIVFESKATDLTGNSLAWLGPTDLFQVFVRDRGAPDENGTFSETGGHTVLISHLFGNTKEAANGDSTNGSISSNGRYIAFQSEAPADDFGYSEGNGTGVADIFLHNRDKHNSGTFDVDVVRTLISNTSSSLQVTGNNESKNPAISGDGKHVVYQSNATDLDGNYISPPPNPGGPTYPDDSPQKGYFRVHVYNGSVTPAITTWIRNEVYGLTNWINESKDEFPVISYDGRYVAFWSDNSYQDPGTPNPNSIDNNLLPDIYLYDRDQDGNQIFDDYSYVLPDYFSRMSIPTNGAPLNDGVGGDNSLEGSQRPGISADGRFVVFASSSIQLASGSRPPFTDANGSIYDIFRHDRETGETILVSRKAGGLQANGNSIYPVVSSDGLRIAFRSEGTNLVSGDSNGYPDIFSWGPE